MKRLAILVGLACVLATLAPRTDAQVPVQFDRLQRADGAKIVPEKFLRSWDPVTVFFPRDLGPAGGGPEDTPERFVTIQPPIAGAWQWLGPRALQFRPAEAWKPLQTVAFTGAGVDARLLPLLPVPIAASPSDASDGITDLDQIALTFAEPVDADALARLTSIELRLAPGVVPAGGQFLTPQDFAIMPLARSDRADKQTYVVKLKSAVPDGRVVILRLRLSAEPGLDEPIYELRLRTAVPFTATSARCGSGAEGQRLDGVLQCQTPIAGAAEDGDTDAGSRPAPRGFVVDFSAKPEALDVVRARDALRISPAVDNLAVKAEGTRLQVSGRFLSDQVYELRLDPGSIKDARNRPLEGTVFVQRFAFAPQRPSLRWDAGVGIVERLGPQLVPLRGGGYDKADIRIHAIDPLSRDFWPFPPFGVETDDDAEPPLPGNEPARWSSPADAQAGAMAARIKAFGSPATSELATLPIRRGGVESKFGLDLKPLFARIAGRDQAGAYLVGVRPVDGGKRRWLRVQVTDLSLTTVEEADRVRFAVTSIATALPVADAEVHLDGVRDNKYVTLARGVTDAGGAFTWSTATREAANVKRIVVTKGLDVLVLDPEHAPSQYAKENWTRPKQPWLAWTFDPHAERGEPRRTLCHVFSERPIYRPEEPVHIKGYLRTYLAGKLSIGKVGGTLVITSPSNQEWRIPVTSDAAGSFYHKFDAQTPATGDYLVKFEPDAPQQPKAAPRPAANDDAEADDGDDSDATTTCGKFSFKKEAYRLPNFEVLLNAPQQVPLDGEFPVDLVARYFAGGLVAERPIKWRASQFPYAWTPPGREGFLFSSDSRFSSDGTFKSTPVLEREGKTDAGGSARMTFDTTIEPTAQPRRYMIEATVTGEDDVQVRNVATVAALPPFVLGVKIPRYLPRAGAVEPEVLAVNAAGEPLAALDMTVRFIKRNWTSVLQASDFSQGSAKYVTEVIDQTLVERKVTSTREAQRLSFEAREAGVYLVQLEAADRLGRRQRVSVDFFVGGDTPVTWARPPSQTATVTTDKESYAPGETATLVIQSPFQKARALAVVEEPEGRFRYDWVDIANGYGRYALGLRKEEMPKLAVHFLIMRGRPWVTVTPVKNIVTVALDYPRKAHPAEEIEVTLRLTDDLGKPLGGEATFWMVDQAVLSLAKERPLDPLPDFIVERPTRMAARDTRGMAFGVIPLEEVAGGDLAVDEFGTDNNVSVRKNFTPVPVFLPEVAVGPDGTAKVKVKLPDSLTVFKLRAKVVSGPDRFGFATGEMMVRQDLVAQPALPRFVRPGDRFEAGLIGRVVEGPSGTGRATIAAEGLTLEGAREQRFAWAANRPARLDFPAIVAEPRPGAQSVRLRFLLQRDADRAADSVQLDLPVRPDRSPERRHEIVEVPPGGSVTLPAVTERLRPGAYTQSLTIAADAAVVRLVAGLNYLAQYPYGCTEQRISLVSAGLALRSFEPILAASGLQQRLSDEVRATIRAIEQSVDPDGLVAFWPRARGNVSLTAWAYSLLLAAEAAGEPVSKELKDRLAAVLKRALRSDYPRLIAGEDLRERVEALTALGEAGEIDQAYAAELGRRADAMPNASVARITAAVARLPGDDRRVLGSLVEKPWARVKILSRDGRPYYAGQAADGGNPVILPSEVKSLAEITRAVAVAAPDDPRLGVLRDGLIRMADGNGWGNTNSNAAAVRALAAVWQRPASLVSVTLTRGGAVETVALSADAAVAQRVSLDPAEARIANAGGAAVVALVDTRYQPAEPGYQAQAVQNGFVLTRQSFRVQANGPMERLVPDADGAIHLSAGDVVEEAAELVNPEDRTHVAIALPIAAGLEPLNPNLATAPAEAAPSAAPTRTPTFVSFADDRVFYAYDSLPKGNYRFVFRTRALIAGSFTQPPGEAETMYRPGVHGASAGQRIVISR
jgi:uncharacterized protein YfaS (alpha-2-macroglobulin family)